MDVFNKILSHSIKHAMAESVDMPDGVTVDGPLYHGTCIDPRKDPEGLMKSLCEGDAIWVSKEKWISDLYAGDECKNNYIQAVFELHIKLDKALVLNEELVRDLSDIFSATSVNDLIPYLKKAGYDGWTTTSGKNGHLHTNIAVFKDEISVSKSKIKVMIDGEWSDFFPVSQFRSIIDEKMKSDHLERFTRVKHV